VGSIVASGYFHELAKHHVTLTVLRRLRSISRADDGLQVELGLDGFDFTERRVVDAVVAEMGTDPVTDVYDDLRGLSSNQGAVDLVALLERRPQELVRNESGSFQLFRIGDAVASRNAQAAILDAARLCQAI
jgi:hypothetical protein